MKARHQIITMPIHIWIDRARNNNRRSRKKRKTHWIFPFNSRPISLYSHSTYELFKDNRDFDIDLPF
jgi:hypothetical protein